MTPERSQAYRRLTDLIEAFDGGLLTEERDQIRAAADALVFSEGLEVDREAQEALRVATDLIVRRVVAGCAIGAVAHRLLIELVGCGLEPPDLMPA